MDTGLIHIYCGDGKGKTTASLGLTIRCAGRGGKVLFTQFLKDMETGELASLARIPGITVIRGKGFKKVHLPDDTRRIGRSQENPDTDVR